MTAMSAELVRHLFSVDDYHQMGEAGVFASDERVELLGGEVIEMSPIGSRHSAIVNRLNRILIQALGDTVIVQVQGPVRLSDLSEPEPDLTLLRDRGDFYATAHPRPADVLLVIEVSDTTIAKDRGVKRPYYAAAGIVETWIIDVAADVIEVGTDPGPADYRHIHQVGLGGNVTPVALPQLTLEVADLLA